MALWGTNYTVKSLSLSKALSLCTFIIHVYIGTHLWHIKLGEDSLSGKDNRKDSFADNCGKEINKFIF